MIEAIRVTNASRHWVLGEQSQCNRFCQSGREDCFEGSLKNAWHDICLKNDLLPCIFIAPILSRDVCFILEATRWFWGIGTASGKEVVVEEIGNDFLRVGLD